MIILDAEIKDFKGKRNNKRIRKLGYIPSVIYKKNENSICIKIKENLFKTLLISKNLNKKIYILINSEKILVNIKNIQYHFFKNKIIHVDFIKN